MIYGYLLGIRLLFGGCVNLSTCQAVVMSRKVCVRYLLPSSRCCPQQKHKNAQWLDNNKAYVHGARSSQLQS
ncbi:hypothetical protein V8F20_003347 [Naviculisporaceae sp. PSN 640]